MITEAIQEHRVQLQPKQGEVEDLMYGSDARWIGVPGSRGAAKSFLLDAMMISRRIALPGTKGMIMMRNYDQVEKFHMREIAIKYPHLAPHIKFSMPANLKIPCEQGTWSQIDFSYADNLADAERRTRSGNYYDIGIDQAEQFTRAELLEIRNSCRWPGVAKGACKMLLAFNMRGVGIQGLRQWFHTKEMEERENPDDFQSVMFYAWDNVEWARAALAEDGWTAEDYYSWTDAQRFEYFVTRTQYGSDLNALPDAVRNSDLLASWDSLEGAYFGRVFDREAMMIDHQQFQALVKPWDTRWLSQDWGKSHFNSTHWHTKITITPEAAANVLGWEIKQPINAFITFREMLKQEMSSDDIGDAIVEATPECERKYTQRFHLSPDAFGERDSVLTIADKIGQKLRLAHLPSPTPADNDRTGGWMAMYNLMQSTRRHGADGGDVWLCTTECPEVLNSIPLAARDMKNLDDVVKTDKGQARKEQDVLDDVRYGLKSEIVSVVKEIPVDVRQRQVFERYAGNPTAQHIAMLKFKADEQKRNYIGRGFRVR